MKIKASEVTREKLEDMGYQAMSCCRGAGYYSNDIAPANLYNDIFNAIVDAMRRNDPAVHTEKKVLLKEVHIYLDTINDEYRGTQIIRYLRRPMTDDEVVTEKKRLGIR